MIRNLQRGSVGEDVENMQAMLNLHFAQKIQQDPKNFPALDTDGKFGAHTEARVRYFQRVNRLTFDGIVGQNTRRAILDFRRTQAQVVGSPTSANSTARSNSALASSVGKARASALSQPLKPLSLQSLPVFGQLVQQQAPPPQAPPQNQPKTVSIVVQQGTQLNANPWFFSPLVLTSQVNYFIRNDGKKPFVFSSGLQFAANEVKSPVGGWTGQGFVQFGPAEITDGPIDWFNPFVQVALQKNANQPFSLNLAIGDQVNWNLINDRLSLFVNGQVVTGVDLHTGLCSAPAVQILGGASFEFVLF